MSIIEVNGITKYFGGLRALHDIAFTLEKGEILGLIGPNGAGKTTLFNIIAGTFPPSSGSIQFNGEEITFQGSRQICHKGISRTYQLVRTFSNLTVYENVLVGLYFGKPGKERGMTEEEARELLRLTGLLQKANIPARSLTLVGRKQLEVARALATRPKVLLLDEAISGLNPTETETMMALIRNIQGRGITVFMIEHIMKAVMGLSDRILVLNFGELIAQGTPGHISKNQDVIEAYLGAEGAQGK
ncbi:MAG TPA: ABC transporter ATP-binding protein [Thermodesulfobacteriota bacterium]|nr:ABC transporter ATP-binding protein [Thermodesulfobacteriota bacterium]